MRALHAVFLTMALAALSPVSLPGQEKQQSSPPLLEELVPAGSMAIFSVPDMAKTANEYRRTIPGKCFEYVFSGNFQKLLYHLEGQSGPGATPDFRAQINEGMKKKTGMTMEEAMGLFSGESAIAVVNIGTALDANPGNEGEGPLLVKINIAVDIVAKIGWNDAAKGEALLKCLIGNVKEAEVEGFKTYTFNSEGGATPSLAVTPHCLLFTTQEDRQQEVLKALKAGKPVAKPLTGDEEYKIGTRNVRKDGADEICYVNWKKVTAIVALKMLLESQAPDLMNDLGLADVRSISYACRFEDARISDAIFFHAEKKEREGILKILSTARSERADGILLAGSGDVAGSGIFGMTALVSAAGMIVPVITGGINGGQTIRCKNNLRSINMGLYLYMKNNKSNVPKATGKEFWKALSPYLIEPNSSQEVAVFRCPFTDKKGISYRGPKAWENVALTQIIGCDDPDNHPDGSICVLQRDGSVEIAEKGSELYRRALEETCE